MRYGFGFQENISNIKKYLPWWLLKKVVTTLHWVKTETTHLKPSMSSFSISFLSSVIWIRDTDEWGIVGSGRRIINGGKVEEEETNLLQWSQRQKTRQRTPNRYCCLGCHWRWLHRLGKAKADSNSHLGTDLRAADCRNAWNGFLNLNWQLEVEGIRTRRIVDFSEAFKQIKEKSYKYCKLSCL